MELWCDADFCGNWKIDMAHRDRTTAKSRTGYIVNNMWAGQMETALSNTEAELIAMSEGLRTTIPLMRILEELSEQDIWLINKRAGVHCRVFKDISGALTIANCQNQGSYQTHKQQILALQGVHGARYNHHTCSILSK